MVKNNIIISSVPFVVWPLGKDRESGENPERNRRCVRRRRNLHKRESEDLLRNCSDCWYVDDGAC